MENIKYEGNEASEEGGSLFLTNSLNVLIQNNIFDRNQIKSTLINNDFSQAGGSVYASNIKKFIL